MSSPDAPVFLTFGTDLKTIHQNDEVHFTAVLTDPDGIDDLIGGSLTSADGSIQYGAFATSGQEGAYSLALSWEDIQDVAKLTFGDAGTLEFEAVFFDAEGHRSVASSMITMTCINDAQVSCDGVCRDACSETSSKRESCDDVCAESSMSCKPGDYSGDYGTNGTSEWDCLVGDCSTVPMTTCNGTDFIDMRCECLPP